MKLYRFDYSCYARKVQMALDICGSSYSIVEVPYGDRNELALLTGGYIQVPVLECDDGMIITDSRRICQWMVARYPRVLIPAPALRGPIWAYHDWIDGPFEELAFRCATPKLVERFERPADAALFRFVKERKYGSGAVASWTSEHEQLLRETRLALTPTLTTLLETGAFLFGEQPTLADAALYGQLKMLEVADPELPGALSARLVDWMRNLEQKAGS